MQNKDKFTINNLFYCCEALIFTHHLVYKFLCGLIFMGHPVFLLIMFTGPNLPIALYDHSMAPLGFGQAILGGFDEATGLQSKIYHLTCYQHICKIFQMSQEMKVPRSRFVTIPIPDSISGCISDSKFGCFHYLFCGKSKEKK